jgi:hypothetical protein
MNTKFKEFLLKQEERQRTTLILLESYLDDKMSSKLSMLPFFQALAPLMVPEMRVVHRIGSGGGPGCDSVMWICYSENPKELMIELENIIKGNLEKMIKTK